MYKSILIIIKIVQSHWIASLQLAAEEIGLPINSADNSTTKRTQLKKRDNLNSSELHYYYFYLESAS